MNVSLRSEMFLEVSTVSVNMFSLTMFNKFGRVAIEGTYRQVYSWIK